MGRRNDHPLTINKIKKIEPLAVSNGPGLGKVSAVVRVAAAQRQRKAVRSFAVRDCFNAVNYVFAPSTEFPAKLRDQCLSALFAGALKRPASQAGNHPGDCGNREEDSEREYQQKFAAKTHGFSGASQSSSIAQIPSRWVRQFFTEALNP